jgi:hypothetical protein
MLRCLPDVQAPGRVLTAAWQAANGAAAPARAAETRPAGAADPRPAANSDHAGLPARVATRAA